MIKVIGALEEEIINLFKKLLIHPVILTYPIRFSMDL